MENSPNISVCIPVYNAERTIARSIQTILNQTHQNFELLIYNDGSTDNSEEIILQFNDKRIIYFSFKENKGIVHARNFLLLEAKGKYIAVQDADDFSLLNRLESQYNFLERNSQFQMVFGGCKIVNNKIAKYIPPPSNFCDDYIHFRNPFIHSTFFARNMFKEYNIFYKAEFEYTEDWELYLHCNKLGLKLHVLQTELVEYTMPLQAKDKEKKYNVEKKLVEIGKLYQWNKLSEKNISTIIEFVKKNTIRDAVVLKQFLFIDVYQYCKNKVVINYLQMRYYYTQKKYIKLLPYLFFYMANKRKFPKYS